MVLAAASAAGLAADQPPPSPFGPEAVKEFSIKRKPVFEFTAKPAAKRAGDRVEISFAVKDYCDVAVAVEDGSGKILRHLAAGVLGDNAPEPLQKNSLQQVLAWDGKNDFGEYVDDIAACTVRVSLGLKAQFEKNLYWHPQRTLGDDKAIAVDKDGVYVYEDNLVNYIRVYDHDGNYVRMLYPFPADKLAKIKGLPWRPVPPDGQLVPDKVRAQGESQFTTSLLPIFPALFKVGNYMMGGLVVHGGKLRIVGERLATINTDGSSEVDYIGPRASADIPKAGRRLPHSVAISPDGKWLYMTRFFWCDGWAPYQYYPQAVYRMPAEGMQEPELFIGAQAKGKDENHFDTPMSVACDSKGRIYVADWENDRIQVFGPDGKFVRGFAVNGPCDVMLSPADEIYVFSWQAKSVFEHMFTFKENRAYNTRVKRMGRKFAPLDGERLQSRSTAIGGLDPKPDVSRLGSPSSAEPPKLLMEAGLDFVRPRTVHDWGGPAPYFHLRELYDRVVGDFTGKCPRFWVVANRSAGRDSVFILEEKDSALALKRVFDDDAARDGYRQHVGGFQRQFLAYDPVRETLFVGEPDCGENKVFSSVIAIDVNTGKHQDVKLPAGAADMGCDARGLIYLRVGDAVARYDPTNWKEVPYDYGDNRNIVASATSHAGKAASAVTTPGGGGSSVKYNAFGVSPNGDVIAGCSFGLYLDNREKKDKAIETAGKKWAPQLYPGRPGSDFVHVFDRFGKFKYEDVLKGGGPVWTGGFDMDFQGNLYANIRAGRILDGRGYGRNGDGTLMKFRPAESRFLSTSAIVPLPETPKRPQEVSGKWAQGSLWAYGGVSAGSTNHCWCRHGQFKVDYFGRSFVPESDRYSVAVLDTNGQVILRIGQYGNADSAGPKSLVPLGGDEVGLFDAHYVSTHTDKRVFISDVGNGRIISVRLDYYAGEKINLKEVPDAGPPKE